MRLTLGILLLLAALSRVPLEAAISLTLGKRAQMTVVFGAGRLSLDYEGELTRGEDRALFFSLRRRGARHVSTRPLGEWLQRAAQAIALTIQLTGAQNFLRRRIQLKQFAADCRLGTGDAALTSVLIGALISGVHWLCAPRRVRPTLRIVPDYAHTSFVLAMTGIFSVQIGQIMAAALLGAWEFGKGRFKHG